MEREQAIGIVFEMDHGTKGQLIEKVGENHYGQFEIMGYITRGMTILDGKMVNTWRITEKGKDVHNFYRKPTEEEKEMGRYCHSIGF